MSRYLMEIAYVRQSVLSVRAEWVSCTAAIRIRLPSGAVEN
jgi:hypothetical protein